MHPHCLDRGVVWEETAGSAAHQEKTAVLRWRTVQLGCWGLRLLAAGTCTSVSAVVLRNVCRSRFGNSGNTFDRTYMHVPRLKSHVRTPIIKSVSRGPTMT